MIQRLTNWLSTDDRGFYIGMAVAVLLTVCALVALVTIATPASAFSGQELHIECYSGGVLIFESEGTGHLTVSDAGTITLKDYNGLEFLFLTGDCLVRPPR